MSPCPSPEPVTEGTAVAAASGRGDVFGQRVAKRSETGAGRDWRGRDRARWFWQHVVPKAGDLLGRSSMYHLLAVVIIAAVVVLQSSPFTKCARSSGISMSQPLGAPVQGCLSIATGR